MDVSVTAETEENLAQTTTDAADINQDQTVPPTILSKQTSEDREVATFTSQNGDLLNTPTIFSDSTSDSGESTSKYPAEEDLDGDTPSNRLGIFNSILKTLLLILIVFLLLLTKLNDVILL